MITGKFTQDYLTEICNPFYLTSGKRLQSFYLL